MADETFLEWPFFSDQHREHARKLRSWVMRHDAIAEDTDVNEACRTWVRRLAQGGWLRSCVPVVSDSHARLDVRTLCLTREVLAYTDGLADFAFAMQGLGAGPITLFGTPEQQRRYLPDVASGAAIMAFALTERDAGSDVAAIATAARRDGDVYVLNGEKTWISNAGIADVYVVFARTSDAGSKGISAFIVPSATAGLAVTERIKALAPHPLGTVRFDNCRIPAHDLLGAEGAGFKIAMASLDVFRPTVGAAALGFSRRALDETLQHVRRRRLFGQPLAAMQLTQSKIAAMATDVDTSALLVYRAAFAKDAGASRITREAAMAKWYATEAAGRIADEAVQLFGARGVMRGECVERLYRDVRALRIYEGASEVQQVVVARSLIEETT